MSISVSRKNEIVKRVHSEFIKELPKDVIIDISRFVFLEPTHPIVKNLNMVAHVQHGNMEIKDPMFNNLFIRHAIIISSQR